MKTLSTDLQGLYLRQLNELLAAESKYEKAFKKLALMAGTEELKSALVSASTEIQQQIDRINQCLDLLKKNATPDINGMDQYLLDTVKQIKGASKPSILKDINILRYTQHIFLAKVIAYQNLRLMADTLKQDQAQLLLGQCANENQNNYAYLLQISGNIIYPQHLK